MSRTSRKLLSQNFLWNRKLVSKLIRDSSISQNDVVLEIGPGKGIITEQLLAVCKKLTAVEIDQRFISFLKRKFSMLPSFHLVSSDFLANPPPLSEPFKVFSNIPYSITGEMVKRLLFSKNPPVDSYLVVQKEAAGKFIANKHRNTMLAILFYPWFEIREVYQFQRSDFKPAPRVDSCLIRIKKRPLQLIKAALSPVYRDFVVCSFNKSRLAATKSPNGWLSKFDEFVKTNDLRARNMTKGSFVRWRAEERKLSKIHRTRIDKAWRNFK